MAVVLDTRFATGVRFLAQWRAWRKQATAGSGEPQSPRHYVGLLAPSEAVALPSALSRWQLTPPTVTRGAVDGPEHAEDAEWMQTLAQLLAAALAQGPVLGPGFARFSLDAGKVALTLCVGDTQTQLGEQQLLAQQVWALPATIPAPSTSALEREWEWDKWQFKRLAKVCQVGARVALPGRLREDPVLRGAVDAAGFVDAPAAGAGISAPSAEPVWWVEFKPRWTLRDPRYRPVPARQSVSQSVKQPPRCAVIGAGLSGASVAYALALRGWSVDVYDQAGEPAAGASGLPVGLLVPHVSKDDAPRSRLSRAGVRMTLAHAHALLVNGQDWQPSGALQLQLQDAQDSQDSDDANDAAVNQAGAQPPHSLWHAEGAWIKPAALVRAWLHHPNIAFHGYAAVEKLTAPNDQHSKWCLRDGDDQALGTAECVVVANARGCAALLQPFLAPNAPTAANPSQPSPFNRLQAIHGGVSSGPCSTEITAQAPPYAVHGNGHFVAGIPADETPAPKTPGPKTAAIQTPSDAKSQLPLQQWFIGATFESDIRKATDATLIHASNLQRLNKLLPELTPPVATQILSNVVGAWVGTRCVSPDRLPLVGPIANEKHPGLWVSAAMGARGLTFAALCAEILVAQLHGEPLPVEASLARQLSSLRT